MKQILTLALALLLMAGCSNGTAASVNLDGMSAEEQYQKSVEVMQVINELEAEMNMELTMSYNGETMTQDSLTTMKIRGINSDTPEAEIAVSAAGQDMTMYLKDNMIYMDMLGTKVKTSAADSGIDSSVDQVELDAYDPSVMLNLTSEKQGEDYLISYQMSQDLMNEYLGDQLSTLQQQIPGAEIQINDASATTLIDKNAQVKQMVLNIDMDMGAEGETINFNMAMTIDYKNLNNVTIAFPEDLDSYQEY